MEILEPRVEGHTCEKIADRLGYKNHSGVVKRMEAIKKRFIQYETLSIHLHHHDCWQDVLQHMASVRTGL